MAKRQTVKKEVQKVEEIPSAWAKKRSTAVVEIEMEGKSYHVSVDIASVLIKKGKAKAK